MKKEKFVLTILFSWVLSVSLVSALDLEYYVNMIGENIGAIFAPIFGVSMSSEFMFAKVLLFFLLFSVIYMVTQKIKIFDGNEAVQIVVALVFSILSVRYLKESELMRAVLLPSGALGASIAIFLPLMVFFMFIHSADMGGFARRAGWFIYGSVFLVFWLLREYSSMDEANWIYILSLGFILISLLFDKSIHGYFKYQEVRGAMSDSKDNQVRKVKKDLLELDELFQKGVIDLHEYDKAVKKKNKRLKKLVKS